MVTKRELAVRTKDRLTAAGRKLTQRQVAEVVKTLLAELTNSPGR